MSLVAHEQNQRHTDCHDQSGAEEDAIETEGITHKAKGKRCKGNGKEIGCVVEGVASAALLACEGGCQADVND